MNPLYSAGHTIQWIAHEKVILSCCLFDMEDGAATDYMIQEGIESKHFYKPAHKIIYHAIIQMRMDDKPVNEVTICSKLFDMGELEAIGGGSYLNEVMNSVQGGGGPMLYQHATKQLHEYYKLWSLARMSQAVLENIGEKKTSEEIIIECNNTIEAMHGAGESHIKKASEYIPKARQELDTPSALTKGILTGFTKYDEMTGGLKPETFVVWAARPAKGKSTIAVNVANEAAIHQNKKVLIFSAEMSNLEIGIRQISSMSMINHKNIRDKRINSNQQRWLDVMTKALAESNLYIDDSADITPSRIAARSRAMKNSTGLDLVIIDYIQIITPDNTDDIREQQIASMTRAFKNLSRRLKIPVLALAQLNRAVTKEEREPRISDLRESGALENDADIVGLLHSDEKMAENNKSLFIIGKHRNGEEGKFLLDYHKYCVRFGDENTLDALKEKLSGAPTQQQLIP